MLSNRLHLASIRVLTLIGLTAMGCTNNIHDNTINIPDATLNVSTDVDVTNVTPGQEVPVTLTVERVYLIEPSMTPPAEHVADAGHVQVYVDDTSHDPILITAQASFTVTIPSTTKAGNHKLICRLHKHDGTPTNTTKEINIVVKVSVTVGDASVIVEIVDGSTGTGGTTGTGGATGMAGAGAGGAGEAGAGGGGGN